VRLDGLDEVIDENSLRGRLPKVVISNPPFGPSRLR
jgi:hypothetical protein